MERRHVDREDHGISDVAYIERLRLAENAVPSRIHDM